MARINRPAVAVEIFQISTDISGLLRPIVASFAQGLPVAGVPKKTSIPTVRHDVVDNACRRHPAHRPAHAAQRLSRQKCRARPAPSAVVRGLALHRGRRSSLGGRPLGCVTEMATVSIVDRVRKQRSASRSWVAQVYWPIRCLRVRISHNSWTIQVSHDSAASSTQNGVRSRFFWAPTIETGRLDDGLRSPGGHSLDRR